MIGRDRGDARARSGAREPDRAARRCRRRARRRHARRAAARRRAGARSASAGSISRASAGALVWYRAFMRSAHARQRQDIHDVAGGELVRVSGTTISTSASATPRSMPEPWRSTAASRSSAPSSPRFERARAGIRCGRASFAIGAGETRAPAPRRVVARPASRASAGCTSARNVASVDTGLPGRREHERLADLAAQQRHARLHAHLPEMHAAELGDEARQVIGLAGGHAAAADDDVAALARRRATPRAARRHRRARARPVRRRCRAFEQAAEAVAIAVVDLAEAERLAGRHELVAGHEQRDARAPRDVHVGEAAGGEHAEPRGVSMSPARARSRRRDSPRRPAARSRRRVRRPRRRSHRRRRARFP